MTSEAVNGALILFEELSADDLHPGSTES
jgi:hypothetical protein